MLSRKIILAIVLLGIAGSTWYFWPELTREKLKPEPQNSPEIIAYIAENIGETNFGGHVFVAYRTLGEEITLDENTKNLYVIALIQELPPNESNWGMGRGSVNHIKIVLRREQGAWLPISYETPRDFDDGTDGRRIFSKNIQDRIRTFNKNNTYMEALNEQNKAAMAAYLQNANR